MGGIDEAGRGSVLGPLVVAGVCVGEEQLKKMVELGVRDSKLLSRAGRMRLYSQIKDIAYQFAVEKILPEKIDKYVLEGKKYRKLNYLEAVVMGRIAGKLDADVIYVDASDVNPDRFRTDIVQLLERKVEVISVHHADRLYPIVSAASIIAKVERDSAIQKLTERYGEFGSGYPSDPRTRRYLFEWFKKNPSPPDCARKSWKTLKKLRNRSLFDHTV